MKTFDTVAQMKLANLQTNQKVGTLGYYTANDGGAATYFILPVAALVDEYTNHTIANGNIASLQLENSNLNLLKCGVVADDSTDNTLAMQAAFVYAKTFGYAIQVPPGTLITGAVEWEGQNIIGQGSQISKLKGLPSQDILYAKRDGVVRNRACLSGITFILDDSVDASGSFSRGGVGNACMAFEWPDGAASPHWKLDNALISDIWFESLSGVAQNKSCGFYNQASFSNAHLDKLEYFRLVYSYYEDYPSANVTSGEVAGDENVFTKHSFNGCTFGPREVNSARSVWNNPRLVGCDTGLEQVSVTSLNRSAPSSITYIGIFIETSTVSLLLSGEGHTFINPVILPQAGNPIDISCDTSLFLQANFAQSSGINVNIKGNYNSMAFQAREPLTDVNDTGVGNQLYVVKSITGGSSTAPVKVSKNMGTVNERAPDFTHRGLLDSEYCSDNSLMLAPDDIYTTGGSSVNTSKAGDTNEFFGRKFVQVGGGSFVAQSFRFDGDPLVIGRDLPATLVRIYVRGKATAGAATQGWKVDVDSGGGYVQVVFASLSWLSTYSVDYFDVDLSAFTLGDLFRFNVNALSVGAGLEIAWISFRPIDADSIQQTAKLQDGITAPAADLGFAQLFVDTADGSLKVIFGNGTVKTLTTNP